MRRGLEWIAAVFICGSTQAADVFRAEPIEGKFYRAVFEEAFGDPYEYDQPIDFSQSPHFRLEGRIEPGDADKLGVLLRKELPDFNVDMFNQVVVSLSSDGGDFYEGLAMADLMADYMVSTIVLPGDRCLSSCAIAFMGGSTLMVRGLPAWPSRYVHDEALLGFHAPFSELPAAIQLPEGTPLTAPLMAQMTNQFYGQAQAAINEIAKRMGDWQLAPNFVFSMLTMNSPLNDTRPLEERFVFVGNYGAAFDTKSSVLTDTIRHPDEVTIIGAGAACDYLLHTATRSWNFNFLQEMNWRAYIVEDVIAEPGAMPPEYDGAPKYEGERSRFPKIMEAEGYADYIRHRRLFPGTDENAFFFSIPGRGIGRVECAVYRDEAGHWRARTHNENIHFPDRDGKYVAGRGADLIQTTVLDFEDGYPITEHMLLGVHGSWIGSGPLVSQHDLSGLPPDIAAITDASFDCGGELDPAAQVICAYPELAAADGRMGALYKLARQKDPDRIRADQRGWFAVRNRVCKPDRIDLSRPIQHRNLAECLLGFTENRATELLAEL